MTGSVRAEDVLAQVVGVALAADLLDHGAEQDEAVVAVEGLRAGLELEWFPGD